MTPSTKASLNDAIFTHLGGVIDDELEDGAVMGMLNGRWGVVPEYTDDLNACHEAEKIIMEAPETPENDHMRKSYRLNLEKSGASLGYLFHASAEQRCRALAAVWGLKIEEEKV